MFRQAVRVDVISIPFIAFAQLVAGCKVKSFILDFNPQMMWAYSHQIGGSLNWYIHLLSPFLTICHIVLVLCVDRRQKSTQLTQNESY